MWDRSAAADKPWGMREFCIETPDGHELCSTKNFSRRTLRNHSLHRSRGAGALLAGGPKIKEVENNGSSGKTGSHRT